MFVTQRQFSEFKEMYAREMGSLGERFDRHDALVETHHTENREAIGGIQSKIDWVLRAAVIGLIAAVWQIFLPHFHLTLK